MILHVLWLNLCFGPSMFNDYIYDFFLGIVIKQIFMFHSLTYDKFLASKW